MTRALRPESANVGPQHWREANDLRQPCPSSPQKLIPVTWMDLRVTTIAQGGIPAVLATMQKDPALLP